MPLSGGVPDEAEIAQSLAAARTCLSARTSITECTPFFVAPNLTLADLHAVPILAYFALPRKAGHCSPSTVLERWFSMMTSRPSMQRTKSRYESGS